MMYNQLISKKNKIAVLGLGNVGLPLALEFAKHFSVIGYDIDLRKVKLMQSNIDPSGELDKSYFEARDIHFTNNSEELRDASFFIIAVPTAIDKYNNPDLRPLLSATLAVANVLQPGDYVLYESTLYPGCTNEESLPLLERVSGLRVRRDFKIGYSPERIVPGETQNSLKNSVKIVSACDADALEVIAKVYETIIDAGVHRAPDIMVAEAAKIVENTQKDVNRALMNEFSILFNKMNIDTLDVVKAVATKRATNPYTPGLVGGHCVGVDPYYMMYKAAELKYHPQMLTSGRSVNDSMGKYIARQTVKKLLSNDLPLLRARVLVMGVTYKPDVNDIRNSKVIDIIKELKSYRIAVDVVDPRADIDQVEELYGVRMIRMAEGKIKPTGGKYHAVIMAVPHRQYLKMEENDFKELLDPKGLVVDINGGFKESIRDLRYWSL